MERRKQKRFRLLLKAVLILNGVAYSGFLEDVSADGMKYVVTSFVNTGESFRPSQTMQILFRNSSGEEIEITGELIWFSRTSETDKEISLGMKIQNPPQAFNSFIDSLG